MIQVTVGNNVHRDKVIVDPNTTLRQVLDDAGIDYSRTQMTLDGAILEPGGLNKTFADYGASNQVWLLAVTKADNAKF